MSLVVPRARWHYAWAIVAITFLTLLSSAGVRAAMGALIKPLEAEFGWDRASISLAAALGLVTLGLGGPLAGTLIDRLGPRRVMLLGIGATGIGLAGMVPMQALWQLHLMWGLFVGFGTAAAGSVLGVSIAHRWFQSRRGLVIGLFGGANSTGQLLFLPSLMGMTLALGWRTAVGVVAALVLALLVPIWFLIRDLPAQMGRLRYGDDGRGTEAQRAEEKRRTPLATAVRTRDFWLLAGSFFVCGYTSTGLIGTHLIPHAVEHGFTEVAAASTVGVMGMMNIFGTLGSGWLADRYDNRKLLAAYYGTRALAVVTLPLIAELQWLLLFGVVYGIDWLATIAPTANLTARRFGQGSLGTLYGWIFCAHMFGGALAAYVGGFFREVQGDYHVVFISAGFLALIAAAMSLAIAPAARPASTPAPMLAPA